MQQNTDQLTITTEIIPCHFDNLNKTNLWSCKEIVLPSFYYQKKTYSVMLGISLQTCINHDHDGP